MDAEDRHAKPNSWPGWKDATFGLELQSPFAGYLLDGRKTIETRAYALPPDLLSAAGREVRIDVLESARGRAGVSAVPDVVPLSAAAAADDGAARRPPSSSSLTRAGWCTFARSFRYATRGAFEADAAKHLVDAASGYGWRDDRPMYGWVVGTRGRYRPGGHGDDDGRIEYATAERRRRSLFELLPRRERDRPTVLITGASGMLGRALHRLLRASPTEYDVIGTGHTRLQVEHYPSYFPCAHDHRSGETVRLRQLDLLDGGATTELLEQVRPDVIVHCAAERDPDAFETKLEGSMKLNVESTRHLARECRRLATAGETEDGEGDSNIAGNSNGIGGPYLIYLSTSYVFDGGIASKEYPPYLPHSRVNPINNYGRSKWEGERAVRDILNAPTSASDGEGHRGIVVRVPLLYGEDCRDLGESPALEMMKAFLPAETTAATEKKVVDHWALRFPTSVEGVARALRLMIDRIADGTFPATANV